MNETMFRDLGDIDLKKNNVSFSFRLSHVDFGPLVYNDSVKKHVHIFSSYVNVRKGKSDSVQKDQVEVEGKTDIVFDEHLNQVLYGSENSSK